MAKRLSYFAPQSARAWSLEAFEEAARRTGVRFIAGAMDDSEERGHELDVPKKLPDMIVNYGLLPQDQFVDAISHSRLLIGVGNPVLYVPYRSRVTFGQDPKIFAVHRPHTKRYALECLL